jgi:hypothetical protein
VSEDVPTESGGDTNTPQRSAWGERLGSVSVDWWATAVGGVIVALAVANVLPKIPW